jgi:hypothetical protein
VIACFVDIGGIDDQDEFVFSILEGAFMVVIVGSS